MGWTALGLVVTNIIIYRRPNRTHVLVWKPSFLPFLPSVIHSSHGLHPEGSVSKPSPVIAESMGISEKEETAGVPNPNVPLEAPPPGVFVWIVKRQPGSPRIKVKLRRRDNMELIGH